VVDATSFSSVISTALLSFNRTRSLDCSNFSCINQRWSNFSSGSKNFAVQKRGYTFFFKSANNSNCWLKLPAWLMQLLFSLLFWQHYCLWVELEDLVAQTSAAWIKSLIKFFFFFSLFLSYGWNQLIWLPKKKKNLYFDNMTLNNHSSTVI